MSTTIPGGPEFAAVSGLTDCPPLETAESGETDSGSSVVIYRDPNDVRLLLGMSLAGMGLVVLLLASLATNIWQFARPRERIVVTRTPAGDQVVQVGNQTLPAGIAIEPDHPGDDDKRTLANKFAEALYSIDPKTREKDIERALRMMVPQSAKALVDVMKTNPARATELWVNLETQRAERWQGPWTLQRSAVDRNDPYKVDLVGSQSLTRIVNGVPQHETRQAMLSLKLVPDDAQGRAERNQHTGFLVEDILEFQKISGSASTGSDLFQPSK